MSATANIDDTTAATVTEPRPPAESEESAAPATSRAPTLSKEETARLGDEIYERDVRTKVEDSHYGEYVAIDVDSRGWAMADDLLAAAASLRAEHPQAVNVWLVRVGYPSLRHFGPRLRRPVS